MEIELGQLKEGKEICHCGGSSFNMQGRWDCFEWNIHFSL